MEPKAKLLYDQHDRKWLAERCVTLDEYLELEISLKLEAVVKLTKLEADNAALKERIDALEAIGAEAMDRYVDAAEKNDALQKQVARLRGCVGDVNGVESVARELAKTKPPYSFPSLWRDCGLRQQQIGEQLLRLCEALQGGDDAE